MSQNVSSAAVVIGALRIKKHNTRAKALQEMRASRKSMLISNKATDTNRYQLDP